MFFRQKNIKTKKRKEQSSLPNCSVSGRYRSGRISLLAPLKGTMTLETACILPLFLMGMIAILFFARWTGVSVSILGGMQETAKELAVLAYAKSAGIEGESAAGDMVTGSLSMVYARGKIKERAALKAEEGSLSLALSSVMKEDSMIDLVGDYTIRKRIPFFSLPRVSLRIRGRVRAWTGRSGSGEAGEGNAGTEGVLVTVSGKVYHRDPGCTHIRLSIKTTNKNQVKSLRNKGGGKYRACELCGGAGELFYITDTGDRYHSSLGCSGLKRSILEVPLAEVENMAPCSRCGGA